MAGLAITGYKYSLSISTNNGSTYGEYGEYVLSSWTSGTSFVIPSLTNGYLYKIKIKAVNSLGDGAESEETAAFKPNTVPGAPTSVVGASGTRGQSSVSWVAPSDNGGTAVSSYTVQYSTSATFASNITTVSPVSSSSPKLVTGLNPSDNGQTYYFRVAATNAGTNGGTGPYSAISAIVTPATVPDAPTIGAMTRGTGASTTDSLAWTAPSSNGGSQITGYVYATNNGTTIVDQGTTGNGTTASKTFNPGYTTTNTTVKVAAVNSLGTGPYSSFSSVGYGGWSNPSYSIDGTAGCPDCAACPGCPSCPACPACTAPTCTCTCDSCAGGCDCGTRTITGSPGSSTGTAGAVTGSPGTITGSPGTITGSKGTRSKTCYKWTRSGNDENTGPFNQGGTAECTASFSTCTAGTCGCTAGTCGCSAGNCGCAAGECSACTGGTCGCSGCSNSFVWTPTYSCVYATGYDGAASGYYMTNFLGSGFINYNDSGCNDFGTCNYGYGANGTLDLRYCSTSQEWRAYGFYCVDVGCC